MTQNSGQEILHKLLKHAYDDEERIAACNALWNLSFNHDAKNTIREMGKLLNMLRELKVSARGTEVCSQIACKSKMKSFSTIVYGSKPLTIVAKLSNLDVLGDPGCIFGRIKRSTLTIKIIDNNTKSILVTPLCCLRTIVLTLFGG